MYLHFHKNVAASSCVLLCWSSADADVDVELVEVPELEFEEERRFDSFPGVTPVNVMRFGRAFVGEGL